MERRRALMSGGGFLARLQELGGTVNLEDPSPTPEPAPPEAPEPMALSETLFDTIAFLTRYVSMSDDQALATALWAVFSSVAEAFDVAPFLHVLSAARRSGKSRLFETLELLVARPWRVISPTEAVLFRKVDRDRPTLLLDEADTIFNVKNGGAEPLRALLNAGNRRGTRVPRCLPSGKGFELVEFDVFCPKAIAGIGRLPDTIEDRSIPIALARRAPHETVDRFRFEEAQAGASSIRTALEAWAKVSVDRLRAARPAVPDGLHDRASESWEPLLAIAEDAGDSWPEMAQGAARALHAVEDEDGSLGVQLLRDAHTVFMSKGSERLATAELLVGLMDEGQGPWAEWWARAVKDGDLRGPGRRVARLLKPYGVEPRKIRFEDGPRMGYQAEDFTDAWVRYLPQPSFPLPGQKTRNNGTVQVDAAFQPQEANSVGEAKTAYEQGSSVVPSFWAEERERTSS